MTARGMVEDVFKFDILFYSNPKFIIFAMYIPQIVN